MEQPAPRSPKRRPDPEESAWEEGAVGLSGSIIALTEGRLPVRKRTFVTGFCAPTTPLPGADLEVRLQRKCVGCSKRRLTTRTTSGPRCNDCLAAR